MRRSGWHGWGLACVCALLALALTGCQGSNSSFANPRPRSRAAAGTNEELPGAGDTSNRLPVDSSGGELSYRQAKLTIPVGAMQETIFVEIAVPAEAPKDVLPESAYQINPDGLELQKEALLTLAYYDQDIPEGRTETDLVIVHQVNGVWVELSNSQVHEHSNIVQAPINFLGLYALRARTIDSRTMNAPPVAQFEFSDTAYPDMSSKSFDDAKKEMEDKIADEKAKAAADEKAAAEDTGTGDAGTGGAAPSGGQGGSATQGPGTPPAGQQAAPPTPQGLGGKAQSMIVERRVVGGPDKAPPKKAAGADKPKSDADSKAGNVAESSAPKKPGQPAQKKQPAAKAEAGDEEAATDETEAGAEATVPQTLMYFNGSKSSDPDGKVVQYDWDFDGDGVFDYSSHSSPYAKWPYYHNGDYTVVLKVTDNGRYPQSGYGTNVVRIRNPKAQPADFSAHITAFPPSGPCPLTVSYASSAIGGTAPYVYRWTFPDGSESTLANPFTTFPSPGPQTVNFSVTDITGARLTGTVTVQSCAGDTPATPQTRMAVDVSPPNMRGQAPFTAHFDVAYDRGTAPVSYNVSFGDETAGQDPLVTAQSKFDHVYPNTGFYLVKIVATDAELRTASTFASVHVYSPEMARDFTPSAEGVGGDVYSFGHKMHIAFDYAETSPRMVRFTAKDTPKPGEGLAYQWDFGDGTFSTDAKPAHTFAKDGVYEVRLTASDDVQRWRHRIWLPVSSKPPAVAIQRPPYTEGPAPLRLNFDAIVTRGEEPLKYEWSFGAGRRQDPSTFYVFEVPGDYKVALEVRDRYDVKLNAPPVEIRVRSGGANYRMPLSIIEPVTGSTRVALIDYNSAYPLPVSSPQIEGPPTLTDLSPDGQRVAIVSDEGVIVKDVANAQPVVAFLPAAGKVVAVVALERDAAYCTVQTSAGPLTYLIRPACDPQYIGAGCVLDASGSGSTLLLKPSQADKAEAVTLYSVDVGAGQAGQPQPFAKAFDAKLSRDGHYAVFIADDARLVRRDLVLGKDEQLSKGDDRKTALAIAADARAVVFDSALGDRKDIIFGRYDDNGVFRLASVTDQTKFYSEHLRLSADGQYLMAYGCREDVLALLKAVKGKAVADDELSGEASDKSVPQGKRPPASVKRYGLIRLDLSGSPDTWSITKVNPHFIVECTAAFDYAGPFD